ncbi:MAG: sodium:solute symporter [Gammaproteobacteria bacterium]|nr:sodium:solute symporter [Gammaproteobacteria bacterium]
MESMLTLLDWGVFFGYFVVVSIAAWFFNRQKISNTNEYFLGGNTMPMWLVAISVLATMQSAATFLGGPEHGYRADLSYLATNIGTIIAAVFVIKFLIPKFYQYRVTTVYELLQDRFGERAKQQAGAMYLIGRVFASGARLYMAAIAVSMILFSDIAAENVLISVLVITAIGALYSFLGGIRAVIYSDVLQFAIYVGAAIVVAIYLLKTIPVGIPEIIEALQNPLDGGHSKLTVLNFDLDFTRKGEFSFWASITGFVLLSIASFGMDQDMTQRVLSCKSSTEATKSLLFSSILTLPIVLLFLTIGLLLYIVYQRPDIMLSGEATEIIQEFKGEKISIFMYYVLNEMPAGFKGMIAIGIVAAGLSTLNSGLNSMSSVLVEDFYRPFLARRNITKTDHHYVKAGRIGMFVVSIALAMMAILSFYWQRYTDTSLLAFALSVMAFSYSGLLGVYFTALFTKRGNVNSVLLSLIVGFILILLCQSYIQDFLNIEWLKFDLAFPYQLCIASGIAFLVCFAGKPDEASGNL